MLVPKTYEMRKQYRDQLAAMQRELNALREAAEAGLHWLRDINNSVCGPGVAISDMEERLAKLEKGAT